MGSPASWSVESWRVKLTSCLRDTPPIEIGIFRFGPETTSSSFFFLAAFFWAFSRTLVGKKPLDRIFLIYWHTLTSLPLIIDLYCVSLPTIQPQT
jgi:hypothetical protein